MRPLLLLLPIIAAACTPMRPPAPAAAVQGDSARYSCDDGTVAEILYGGGGTVVLTIGERTVQMSAAAGDPSRFSGEDLAWSVVSPREGMLTMNGSHGSPPTRCKAS